MKVLMLETRRGTEDGFTVNQYLQGEVYDLRDHLAFAFLAASHAVPLHQKKKPATKKRGKKNDK